MTPEIETTLKTANKVIEPVRKSLLRRFPIVFTLLVAFGAAATFFGVERIFQTISFFNDHPWRSLLIGVVTLAVTGKLYAKLG